MVLQKLPRSRLVLGEEDAASLERLVKRRREIATDEHAEPLTDDEKHGWEGLLGKAAGDEQLFARKRKDAEARQSAAYGSTRSFRWLCR